MKSNIKELLEEIRKLEEELVEALSSQQVDFFYKRDGAKVKFEKAVENAHRKLKVGLLEFFRNSNPLNIISAPFIYAMIFPFLILDLSISIYQIICFPLYRIAKVNRRRYLILDRHNLHYLNSIEKFNCIYCGYVNGLIAYSREIVARTEQYWCPIKHAKRILDSHRRYASFSGFGESDNYHLHLKRMRGLVRASSGIKDELK